MRRAAFYLACILVAALAGAPKPATAHDANEGSKHKETTVSCDFKEPTLNDKYGFHSLATMLNPNDTSFGASHAFAVAGYYNFHGDGTLDGKDTLSTVLSGTPQIVHREYTGTYHVEDDGTGWLVLNVSPSFQPKGEFVITKCGKQIEIIFAVPGNLNTFTLSKQHAR